jgi:SAM-dependent methyltransferase
MQAYGKAFARVYNARWGSFTDLVAPKIEHLFASASDELGLSKRLVDLCCGTGTLAHYFLEKGYSVKGIDLSPHMIEYAIQRNRFYVDSGQASFTIADAACFDNERAFSFVTCLYDALNHLPSMQAISSCIQRAFDAIDGKGLFVFDINTKKSLREWNKTTIQEDDEIYMSTKGIYDASMDRAYTQITGFVRDQDGKYERFSETVYNLAISTEYVLSATKSAGFKSTYCTSMEDLTAQADDPESIKRVFFVCKKA